MTIAAAIRAVSKRRKRLIVTSAGAALVVALGIGSAFYVGVFRTGQQVFRDGQGPLASTGNFRDLNSEGFPALGSPFYTGPRTLGFRLCVREGNKPAVLKSVAPARTTGDGFRVLGVRARKIDLSKGDKPIMSVSGFPPRLPLGSSHPDTLSAVDGFRVAAKCGDITHSYDELLVGLDAVQGAHGGGWLGIDVTYRVGSSTHVVELPYDFFICGPDVARAYHVCAEEVSRASTPSGGAANSSPSADQATPTSSDRSFKTRALPAARGPAPSTGW
jgi:hypothetical protein